MERHESRRVALVTGGSRGIGRAVAERLARDGFDVVLTFRERQHDAADVVRAIEGLGGSAVAVSADLARGEDVPAIFSAVDEAFGRLDALVLNAGALAMGPLETLSDTDFDWGFAVNVRSAFVAFREAAARLESGGRVVAVSSDLTRDPAAGTGAYSAGKAAVESLTRTLAHELGPRGITANAVLPGLTRTEGLILSPEAIEALVAQTPLRRVGEPDDIADVIGFLVSPAGRWITGQAICVDGGLR